MAQAEDLTIGFDTTTDEMDANKADTAPNTILLVEDNDHLRSTIVRTLKRRLRSVQDSKLEAPGNPKELHKIIEETGKRIGVIILDVDLTKWSMGLSAKLLPAIKRHCPYADIVIHSGMGYEAIIQASRAYEGYPYIEKPSTDILKTAVTMLTAVQVRFRSDEAA